MNQKITSADLKELFVLAKNWLMHRHGKKLNRLSMDDDDGVIVLTHIPYEMEPYDTEEWFLDVNELYTYNIEELEKERIEEENKLRKELEARQAEIDNQEKEKRKKLFEKLKLEFEKDAQPPMNRRVKKDCKKFSDTKPDETGIYIYDTTKTVNVWTQRTGSVHGSDDYYTVYIETTDGEFVARWDNEVYSMVPSFVVGGSGYYK